MPDGPLADLNVVSLAINLPGPAAAARFSALGASVTTFLPPAGDPLQALLPDWFDELHADQQVQTVDLKTPQGLSVVHEALAQADLLITASRPSALARLGLDFASLSLRHPRLCQVAVVGHPGAAGDNPGHDLTYQAEAGTVRPPNLPTTLVADMAGAERAVAEGLVALHQRERTGVGVFREVALADVAQTMAQPAQRGMTSVGGVLGGAYPGYGVYRSSDGHVALAALEAHFAQRLSDALGVELTEPELTRVLAAQPGAHWQQLAREHDLPLVVVREF